MKHHHEHVEQHLKEHDGFHLKSGGHVMHASHHEHHQAHHHAEHGAKVRHHHEHVEHHLKHHDGGMHGHKHHHEEVQAMCYGGRAKK